MTLTLKDRSVNEVATPSFAHPGLELQQVELQQLGSGSQAQSELLVLFPLAEMVPLALVELAARVLVVTARVLVVAALVAALVQVEAAQVRVEAALVAAPVADMVGNERRMVA